MQQDKAFGIREDVTFEILLPGASEGSMIIWGQLNSPGPTKDRTLLVLLSGGTYDHIYWDFPGFDEQYSFVIASNRAGFATLNLDRLGLGNSARPAADLLTVPGEAAAIHQVVAAFRRGAMSAFGFGKIILIGHSLGSAIAVQESVTYGDVDSVVLTGLTHSAGPDVPAIVASQVEASSIPGLGISNSPVGYLTTAPGARALFYNMADADPAVVARDERLRSTVTKAGNISLGALLGDPAVTNAVKVPVLSIFGAEDRLFNTPGSESVAEKEHTFFRNSSSHETIVVPSAGHVLSLSRSAGHSSARILQWIEERVS